MRTLICSVLAAAVVVGGPLAVAAKRSEPPPAKPVGEAKSCIPIISIRETRVHGDRVIDFHTTGKMVYRNTLPQDCPQLGFEERFTYSTSLSQLCSTDIITVLYASPPMRGASCGLGQFQPVELIKPAKVK